MGLQTQQCGHYITPGVLGLQYFVSGNSISEGSVRLFSHAAERDFGGAYWLLLGGIAAER